MARPHPTARAAFRAVRAAPRGLARLREEAGRLRWRLGAGYLRVTLAAVVVVEALGILVLTQAALMTREGLHRDVADRLAPVAAELLDAEVGPAALAAYLTRPTSPLAEGLPLLFALPSPPQGLVLVARPDGSVWFDNRTAPSGGGPPLATDAVQARLRPGVAPAEVALAREALREGEARTWRGFVRTGHAVPLLAPSGATLGVLLLSSTLLPFSPGLVTLGVAVLVVATLLVALAGTVYGLSTSRPLVRRIEAVADAADAWSRGDFSLAVRDGSDDELGRLARRLDRMAEELQGLVEVRQALASTRERDRLARELHDSVKQQVFAAAMRLGAARTIASADWGPGPEAGAGGRDDRAARLAPHLAAAEALVLQAQQELSDLIHEVRPLAVDGRPLGAAVRALLTSDGRPEGLEVDLDVDPSLTAPPELGTAAYRIAQEAIANVARHAAARRLRVALRREADALVLDVHDDGVGFDPVGGGDGVGLTSMRERAEALGGRFRLRSRPGGGTRLRVTLPLAPEEPPRAEEAA